jgi:iron only hydrogenase large subunit-like protein
MSPVYTLTNECQDCYKCVRRCPVKAIKIQDSRAGVIPHKCISCGNCVLSCPSNAKQVRNDIDKVRQLLQFKEPVIVSLAPSWRGAFEYSNQKMISILQHLGFSAVSETALGAQEVSIETASMLNHSKPGLYISSACPVIVDYIRYYRPEFTDNIATLASPALTHAKLLKNSFGEDVRVVFIGPCIGKKNESDRHQDLISAALTFEELKIWFKEEDIDVNDIEIKENASFVPEDAKEGAIYPMDGGMNKTISRVGVKDHVQLINISSLDLFAKSLNDLDLSKIEKTIFVEALACVGGCISGPCMSSKRSDFSIISDVLTNTSYRTSIPKKAQVVVPLRYESAKVETKVYSLEELQKSLKVIGKLTPSDELNCGGCGYQTCRGLAKALLDGDAEPQMCVSYMRQLAIRKADAMFKFMPSAMIMLDKNFNISEANEAFIRMFSGKRSKLHLSHPDHIIGCYAGDILGLNAIFKKVLKSGNDIRKERYSYQGKFYALYIFCAEKGESIGVLITDTTPFQGNKEKIATRAREVISKNITIVQEIASMLGEHMVETETLLSSIADDFDEEEGN